MAEPVSRQDRTPRLALVLCLGALFFLLCTGVALLSSSVYRATVAAGDENFTRRTALSYLANQVRRAEGTVAVGRFGESDAVRLTETADTGTYETILYCYDGQLMELYAEAGSGFAPEDGIAILPLAGLTVTREGPLLTFTVTDAGGAAWSVSLAPRLSLEEVGAL